MTMSKNAQYQDPVTNEANILFFTNIATSIFFFTQYIYLSWQHTIFFVLAMSLLT